VQRDLGTGKASLDELAPGELLVRVTPRSSILVLVATHWTICFDAAEPQRIAAFRAATLRAKAADLVALGATVVREEHYGEQMGHIVMLDPERNELCVA
jgi:hypothetical protein